MGAVVAFVAVKVGNELPVTGPAARPMAGLLFAQLKVVVPPVLVVVKFKVPVVTTVPLQ